MTFQPIYNRIPQENNGVRRDEKRRQRQKRDDDGIPIDPDYTPSFIPEHHITFYRISRHDPGEKAKKEKGDE